MIKDGVKLHPATIWAVAMPIIFEVYRDFDVSPVITSGMEGKHSSGSLHYAGLAFDFRTRHVKPDSRFELAARLQAELGEEFDVVLEADHIHIEWDPDE